MPTLYQQLQQYAARPDAVHFSKKKIKLLGFIVSRVYDRASKGTAVQYVQSQEGDREHKARNYPENFAPVIDNWINRFHRHIKFGHPLKPPQKMETPTKKQQYAKRKTTDKK